STGYPGMAPTRPARLASRSVRDRDLLRSGTRRRNDVTGVNVDLVPGRRIVQAWRHRRFHEGVFSMAAVTLTPTPDGGTELVLTHRGVPKDLIPETEQTWREQYWSRIKAYIDREVRKV